MATRALALNPTSAQARARLRAATQAVAEARTALETARRTLDLERLRDLEGVFTTSDLLDAIPGSHVLGLFPVTLEARLDPGRLRIRVWPDAISTSTHDPRLTPRESTRPRSSTGARRRRRRTRPSRGRRGGRWRR